MTRHETTTEPRLDDVDLHEETLADLDTDPTADPVGGTSMSNTYGCPT